MPGGRSVVAEFALSAEQAAVFELIENTRENIFVTGRAGTGKSTLLNHLSWNTAKQVVIAARPVWRRSTWAGRPSTRSSACRSG
jgi:predicted GTPase